MDYAKLKADGLALIDESEKTDVHIFNGVNLGTASQEDVDRTLNSVIIWLRADDSEQTLWFVDSQQLVKYTIKDNAANTAMPAIFFVVKTLFIKIRP